MKIDVEHRAYGSVAVLASAIFFGSYGVWSRLIGAGMGNFFQGWTRALIIIALILPCVLWRKEIVSMKKEDWKWLVVFLAFTSMTQAPLFYAFNHMSIGTASLLFFVSMFLTMNGIGVGFFSEKISAVKLVAIAMAITGMCFVFSFSLASFSVLALAMAIMGGIASGGEVAFSKKLSARYSPLYVTLLSWGIILITNVFISLALQEPQIIPSFSAVWFWQLCYSIVSLFGFWLVIWGFKYVDATVGSLIGLLEIVFGIIFGMIFFREVLTVNIMVGGILIIGAAALSQLGAQRA